MRHLTLLAALSLSTSALAVPLQVQNQGRLFDGAGSPLTGSHDLTIALYDAPSGGTALYQEDINTAFDNGFYAVTFGAGDMLAEGDFDGQDLWIGLAIDAGPEISPRLKVDSTPYAITAGSVSGGLVNASSVQVNGTTVIDSSGTIDFANLVNVPAGSDTLGDLTCDDNDVAVFASGAWACSDVTALTIDASQLVGTIDITNIPTGDTTNTVAAGDHVHDASDVTSGQLDNARLPTDIAAAGSLSAATTVSVGGTSDACDNSNAGALRTDATTGRTELCIANTWRAFAFAIGSDAMHPGYSCDDILRKGSSFGDGVYWIDPDRTGAYQVWCDMTTDGGGWTLLLKTDGNRTPLNYTDALWTDRNLLNETDVSTDTTAPSKYESFTDLPLTALRACFPTEGGGHCATKTFTSGPTAVGIFAGAADTVNGHPDFLSSWSTQPNCQVFGINTPYQYRRARFGWTANQENDCNSNDTAIGFGLGPLNHGATNEDWSSGELCLSSNCTNGNQNRGFPGLLWAR